MAARQAGENYRLWGMPETTSAAVLAGEKLVGVYGDYPPAI
jgi:hypothetical protein